MKRSGSSAVRQSHSIEAELTETSPAAAKQPAAAHAKARRYALIYTAMKQNKNGAKAENTSVVSDISAISLKKRNNYRK